MLLYHSWIGQTVNNLLPRTQNREHLLQPLAFGGLVLFDDGFASTLQPLWHCCTSASSKTCRRRRLHWDTAGSSGRIYRINIWGDVLFAAIICIKFPSTLVRRRKTTSFIGSRWHWKFEFERNFFCGIFKKNRTTRNWKLSNFTFEMLVVILILVEDRKFYRFLFSNLIKGN